MSQLRRKLDLSYEILPDDVVFDILTRLSVKSLIRFKCVSKSWYATITSRIFIGSLGLEPPHQSISNKLSKPKIWRVNPQKLAPTVSLIHCSLAKKINGNKNFNTPIKIFNFYSTIITTTTQPFQIFALSNISKLNHNQNTNSNHNLKTNQIRTKNGKKKKKEESKSDLSELLWGGLVVVERMSYPSAISVCERKRELQYSLQFGCGGKRKKRKEEKKRKKKIRERKRALVCSRVWRKWQRKNRKEGKKM